MYTVTANYGVGFPEKPTGFTPVSWEANLAPADNDGAYNIYVYNITVTAGNTSSVDFTLKGTSPL